MRWEGGYVRPCSDFQARTPNHIDLGKFGSKRAVQMTWAIWWLYISHEDWILAMIFIYLKKL
jgi:hypothetical protein